MGIRSLSGTPANSLSLEGDAAQGRDRLLPKWHDIEPVLLEQQKRFPEATGAQLSHPLQISRWLRKERELACCGDIDFIRTEQYQLAGAQRANDYPVSALGRATRLITGRVDHV